MHRRAILSRRLTVSPVSDAPDPYGNTFERPVILREGTQVQGDSQRRGSRAGLAWRHALPAYFLIGRFCSIARGAALALLEPSASGRA